MVRGRVLRTLAIPILGAASLLIPGGARASFPGDNGLIAFQNDSLGGVYSIRLNGSNREFLDDGFEPSWSASGKRIIYVDHASPSGLDDTEVYSMKANGSDKRRITHDNVSQWEPAYSPDSKQIVYRTGKFRSADGKLYVADSDGSHRDRIGRGRHPDWSVGMRGAKDGLIAFTGESSDPCFGENEIITVKPSGKHRTVLPFGCDIALAPSWGAEGDILAFAGYPPAGNSDIYTGPANGDEDSKVQLSNLPGQDEGTAFSPDGTRVAFNDGDNGLYYVDVATPLTEVAVPNTADVVGAEPAWQPRP